MIRFVICFLVNIALFSLYKLFSNEPLRIVETMYIIVFGIFMCFSIFSVMINPAQFFKALIERLVRPISIVIIIIVRTTGLIILLVIRLIRILITIILILVYGVWPIDLIPDIILGLGWLDDVAVTMAALNWGLAFGKMALSDMFREFADRLNQKTVIKTKFPY